MRKFLILGALGLAPWLIILLLLAGGCASSQFQAEATDAIVSQAEEIDALQQELQQLRMAQRLGVSPTAVSAPAPAPATATVPAAQTKPMTAGQKAILDAEVAAIKARLLLAEANWETYREQAERGYTDQYGVYHNGYGYSSWWSYGRYTGPRGVYLDSNGWQYPLYKRDHDRDGRRYDRAVPRHLRMPDAKPQKSAGQKPAHLRTPGSSSGNQSGGNADHTPRRKPRRK